MAAPATPSASAFPATVADELRALAELREQGIITDEEFQKVKAKLIEDYVSDV